jgi:hypothetical protein
VLPTKRIAHRSATGDCCAAGFQSSLCRRWVKTGKAQTEQMFSGLPPIADIALRGWHFRIGPLAEIPPPSRARG